MTKFLAIILQKYLEFRFNDNFTNKQFRLAIALAQFLKK